VWTMYVYVFIISSYCHLLCTLTAVCQSVLNKILLLLLKPYKPLNLAIAYSPERTRTERMSQGIYKAAFTARSG